jgi:tight adherence protein C
MQNSMLLLLLSLALFILALGVLLLSMVGRTQERLRLQRRLDGRAAGEGEEERPDQWGAMLLRALVAMERGAPAALRDAEIGPLLIQCGWRGPVPSAIFFALRLAVPVLGALIVGTVLLGNGSGGSVALLGAFVAAALGYLLPKQVLRMRAKRRRRRIADEIPILLHLLRTLFEAGLSLEQALREAGQSNPRVLPLLSQELDVALRHIGAGVDPAEALDDMARPLEVSELSDLVKMLGQMYRQGGSIRQSLMDYTELLEDRRRTQLQERIGKLSAKMTIVMVLFMFPALLIFVAGPGVVGLFRAIAER